MEDDGYNESDFTHRMLRKIHWDVGMLRSEISDLKKSVESLNDRIERLESRVDLSDA